jgi:hypothetical protein
MKGQQGPDIHGWKAEVSRQNDQGFKYGLLGLWKPVVGRP